MFAALCAREIWRSPQTQLRPGAGFALLGFALLWQFLCVDAGWIRFARPALALAVAGLSLCLGRAALRAALMALFCVPVPSLLLDLANQRLAAPMLAPALSLLRALGRPTVLHAALLQAPGASLEWIPADAGVALAVFAVGLACRELPRALPLRSALGRIAVSAALAFALAALTANAATVLLAATGREAPARFVLRQLPWLAVLGVAFWRARRAAGGSAAAPA